MSCRCAGCPYANRQTDRQTHTYTYIHTCTHPYIRTYIGLAAGAMIWVSLMELVPEAREEWDAQEGTDSNTDKGAVRYRDLQIGVLLVVSAVGMILFTHLLT